MISVVIPLYNKEKQIAGTLHSVLAQTFQDFEVVIVNDGSTDRSAEVVKMLDDHRIRLINQNNAGVSAARNRGIAEAYGEFVAFLDADDEWSVDYLSTQYMLTQEYPQCDVFVTNYSFKDEYGQLTHTRINGLLIKKESGILTNYFKVASISNPPICASSVMVRKKAIKDVGGFPMGIVTGEDLLVWAKLAAKYNIAYTKKVCAFYYVPLKGTDRIDPKDMSIKNDIVRIELKKMLKSNKPENFKRYLSFWDKMRAVINLRKGERREALNYCLKSVGNDPFNYKAWILMGLCLSPNKFIKKLI